jgi:flavodoxin
VKVLVVYYSRTGNTKLIASEVAAALGADVEELKDRKNRQGLVGWMNSGRDARRKRPADLEPVTHDPAAYDLVVLGGPVWAFTICSPTRTYALTHRDSFKRVAFMCTLGDYKYARKAFAELNEVTGMEPAATLGVTEGDVHDDHADALAEFVEALNHAHLVG